MEFNFKQATPRWQGMMDIIYQINENPGKSSVRYLPMIDMYSGNIRVSLMTGKSVNKAFHGHLHIMMSGISHFVLMVKESEELYISLLKADMTLETVFTSKTIGQIN